ncbi:hypothetical protein, partial [Corynebacterium diphtheriae]|uniref:hypothetical protein n=1 Tax=Corynebacterium diphtheriae TaxID=1717 RepID=UPI00210C4897
TEPSTDEDALLASPVVAWLTLFSNEVIALPCDVFTPSALDTRVVSAVSAAASALVATEPSTDEDALLASPVVAWLTLFSNEVIALPCD